MPEYRCPSTDIQDERTTYVVVVDLRSVFPGERAIKIPQVIGGTTNTMTVVETSPGQAVPWMSPQDIDMQTFLSPRNSRQAHLGGAQATLCDGSVRFLSDNTHQQVRRAVVTRKGMEEIGDL